MLNLIFNFITSISFPQWDTDLFLLLNGMHARWADIAMWRISGNLTFVPLYVIVLIILCRREKWRKSLFIMAGAILCIVLADRISSGLIKPLAERLRPSHALELQGLVRTLRGYAGGQYGFVSSHAANHFAFAMFSLLAVRRKYYAIFIILLAFIVSYSRIYLGVHYPLDVAGGAMLGIGIGCGVYWLQKAAYRHFICKNHDCR